MQSSLWDRCVQELRSDLSEQQFNTWIRPLQAVEDEQHIRLLAPNRFVVDWVSSNCLGRIQDSLRDVPGISVRIEVGSAAGPPREPVSNNRAARVSATIGELVRRIAEAVLVSNMEFDGYPCSITVEKVSDSAGPRSDV